MLLHTNNQRTNDTKAGVTDPYSVPSKSMWSNTETIKAPPPEKRKSPFFLGKVPHSWPYNLEPVPKGLTLLL